MQVKGVMEWFCPVPASLGSWLGCLVGQVHSRPGWLFKEEARQRLVLIGWSMERTNGNSNKGARDTCSGSV